MSKSLTATMHISAPKRDETRTPTQTELARARSTIADFLIKCFAADTKKANSLRGSVIPATFSPEDLRTSRSYRDFRRVIFLLPYLGLRNVDIFAGKAKGRSEADLLENPEVARGCYLLHCLAKDK